MPLIQVTRQRAGQTQRGYKWGERGHAYYGPGARAKALLQARAIWAQRAAASK